MGLQTDKRRVGQLESFVTIRWAIDCRGRSTLVRRIAYSLSLEHLIGPTAGRAGDLLVRELRNGRWCRLTGLVAFARMSGVKHVEKPLREFIAAGGHVDLTLGMDVRGTTYEAVWYLMNALAPKGRILLASSEPVATFHPKIFIFSDAELAEQNTLRALRSASEALVVIGSSNLTEGGLFKNDEASTIWRPNLSNVAEQSSWVALLRALSPWLTPKAPPIVCAATASSIKRLALEGRLPRELALIASRVAPGRGSRTQSRQRQGARRTPTAPPLVGPPPPALSPPSVASPPGLSVLIARLSFGGSRRWPQWELNSEVLGSFFGISMAGETIQREAVNRLGERLTPEHTPLVIGTNKNRRLEFPEPDGRLDPAPSPALLVVVDRRPGPFRYTVLLPEDSEYVAAQTLNASSTPIGQHVAATKRVVVSYAALAAIWPNCPL